MEAMFYLAEPLSRQRKAVSDMQWDSSIEEVKEIAAKDFDLPLEDVGKALSQRASAKTRFRTSFSLSRPPNEKWQEARGLFGQKSINNSRLTQTKRK